MIHRRAIAIVLAALATGGCQAARVATNQCALPYVAGEVTLDVTALGSTRRYTLTGDGGRPSGSARHDIIQASLLGGEIDADTGVTWVVSSGDGAQLVVTHRAELGKGDQLRIAGAPGQRNWGTGPSPALGTVGVAVILPDATQSDVTGMLRVRRLAPLELDLDLEVTPRTGSEASRHPRRVTGVVRFRRAIEERPCFS